MDANPVKRRRRTPQQAARYLFLRQLYLWNFLNFRRELGVVVKSEPDCERLPGKRSFRPGFQQGYPTGP